MCPSSRAEHLVLQWLRMLFKCCDMVCSRVSGRVLTTVNAGSGLSSTGTQPYCVTFTYDSDYLSFVCSEQEGLEYQMEPYWSGFSDPIAFPVYTGSNGISTGTQYPPGYPTPSSTTSSTSESTSNPASRTAQGNSGSSTSGNNASNQQHNSPPVGAIVGGVIGGLALISLVVGAIVFFAIIHPRHRLALAQPPYHQPGPLNPPQYPPPVNPPMANAPAQYTADQNPPPHQAPRYEFDTQQNKPELDSSGRYELH